MTGPHASVHFENGQNAKNAHEMRKMCNRITCFCAFRKWCSIQGAVTQLNGKVKQN